MIQLGMVWVTLAWPDGAVVVVPGFVEGALALHRAVALNGVDVLDLWTVTHVPTGHLLGVFESPVNAGTFMDALTDQAWDVPLADWRPREGERACCLPSNVRLVEALLEECGGMR